MKKAWELEETMLVMWHVNNKALKMLLVGIRYRNLILVFR